MALRSHLNRLLDNVLANNDHNPGNNNNNYNRFPGRNSFNNRPFMPGPDGMNQTYTQNGGEGMGSPPPIPWHSRPTASQALPAMPTNTTLYNNRTYKHLTPSQIESFMTHGYCVIPQCFSAEAAATRTADVWERLGFDPHDKSTWSKPVSRLNFQPGSGKAVRIAQFAPRAWAAISELVGGEDRIAYGPTRWWGDAFIVNVGSAEAEAKAQREGVDWKRDLNGWHVDGNWFVHFLDSPEQGLLVVPLWTDVEPFGGGTVVATEGIGMVAKFLHDHPSGVGPGMVPLNTSLGTNPTITRLSYHEIIAASSEPSLHELTGRAGDVVLIHPLMVHSVSTNPRRLMRIITNPCISLREPFNFDRDDPAQYSVVELKTLRDLGVDRLPGWQITAARQKIVPEQALWRRGTANAAAGS